MKALSTNAGMNWIGFLILVYQGIDNIPDGVTKHILTGLCLTVAAVVAFATKGSGIPPDQGADVLDATKELSEVLKDGRE
jgi:hypothetical protein